VGAFGEKLRQQREQRGISLDAISATTKISNRMLRAIEDERFDQLPGGVFNKGFVRAYARQVGLDEEEAVADYLLALRENQLHSQTILPNFRAPSASKPASELDEPDRRNPARDLLPHAPANSDPHNQLPAPDRHIEDRRIRDRRIEQRRSQAGRHEAAQPGDHPADETLGEDLPSPPLSFLNLDSAPSSGNLPRHSESEPLATQSLPSDSSRVPWGKLAVALLLITLGLALWTLHRRSQFAAASQPATTAPTPIPVSSVTSAPTQSSAPTASPRVSHAPATAAALTDSDTPSDSDLNPPVAKPAIHTTPPKAPPAFTLVIRASETSWIAITADGQPVAHETLIAPANTSVRAAHEITVRVGNAAGISFLLNGKEIPTSGNPGEVRTYTFDATGMRESDASPPQNAAR